jgi:hypothetical protein
MINAKRAELEKMFYVHYSVFRANTEAKNKAHRLLLFYAVECGLKYLILSREGANTTAYFEQHIRLSFLKGKNGHDIKYMLNYLNYPDIVLPDLHCSNNQIAKAQDYNQVWRYGIMVDLSKEKEIEEKLTGVAKWIDMNIGRGL